MVYPLTYRQVACLLHKKKKRLYLVGETYIPFESESEKSLNCVWLFVTHGILQTRILERLAFPFSRGSSQPRDRTQVSHIAGGLYQLSHKGNPRILEWVAYPFSSGFSQPRNWTRVFSIASRFFTNWAIREDSNLSIYLFNWIVHSIDISWVPTVYQNLPDFVSGNSKINKTCPRRIYSLVKEIDIHINICNAIW